MGKRDLDKAKALIKEAGYKGERIVVMDPTDQPIQHAHALVVTETLKKLGLTVDLQAMDWSTLITRRAIKEPVDKNGWSLFFTFSVAPDFLNPALNASLRANGDKAWFGWPSDEKIETLRAAWMTAPDLDAQKKIAEQIQVEAFKDVPYIPTGQFVIPTAFHAPIKGVLSAPIAVFWNVEKP
jgi:peptide/nickel transport system substrate-binding protein